MTTLDSAIGSTQMPVPDPDASRVLAAAYHATEFEKLSPEAVEAARRGILDTVAVSLAAAGLGEDVAAVLHPVRTTGGHPQATLPGLGDKVPVPAAAFVFGAFTHMLDYDDVVDSAVVHPSAAVVAAVLPVAEWRGGVTGRELLTAVAIGHDLNVRLAQSLDAHSVSHGWLPSVIAGFGAGAAVARLLGFDAEQTQHVLGLALHQAGGSRQAGVGAGSSVRAVRDGFNAQNAVNSALLVQAGARGDRDAFEGQYGLFNLYFGGAYSRTRLLAEAGVRFRGELAGHKPWPSCRYSHLFIDPLLRLLTEHDLAPDDIRRITALSDDDMLTGQCEPRDVRARPTRGIDAKTSLPFQLGKIAVHRRLVLDDFTPAGLADPAAIAVAERVDFRVEPDTGHAGLGHGAVAVELADGRTLSATAEALPGSVDAPLPWSTLEQKFRDCAAHAPSRPAPAAVDAALAVLRSLEQCPDVSGLIPGLSGAAASTSPVTGVERNSA